LVLTDWVGWKRKFEKTFALCKKRVIIEGFADRSEVSAKQKMFSADR